MQIWNTIFRGNPRPERTQRGEAADQEVAGRRCIISRVKRRLPLDAEVSRGAARRGAQAEETALGPLALECGAPRRASLHFPRRVPLGQGATT